MRGAVRKERISGRLKRELWGSRARGIVHIVSRETMARLSYRSVAVQRRGAGVIALPGKTKGRPLLRPPDIYETGCIRIRLPVDAHGATDDGQRENGEPHEGHLLLFLMALLYHGKTPTAFNILLICSLRKIFFEAIRALKR